VIALDIGIRYPLHAPLTISMYVCPLMTANGGDDAEENLASEYFFVPTT
jgi:hypothetical protein